MVSRPTEAAGRLDDGWYPADGSPLATRIRILALVGPPLTAALALVLAWGTLMPGVGFWDTAEFQAVPPVLGTLHPTGFPAYAVLGWLASILLQPLGEPAFRMNVFSAICVAGAVGLTTVLVRQLTGRPVLAIAVGLLLFLTELTWNISTHADAHALHLFLLALVIVLLVGWEERASGGRDSDGGPADGPEPVDQRGRAGSDRWLIAAAAAYGVAVANHSLALLALPGIGLYVLAVEPGIFGRRGIVLRCLGAGLGVTALLFLELPLRAGPFRAPIVYGHPETLSGFLYVVFGQQFGGALVAAQGTLGARLGGLADLAATQLGILAPALPFAAAATILRRWRYAILTGPTLVLTCLFALLYDNADITRYYLGPLLIALTWLAILVDGVVRWGARVFDRAWTGPAPTGTRSVAALLVLEVAAAAIVLAPATAAADVTRSTVDESHDTAAAGWLDTTLRALAPDAVVISWWSFSTPLWYARDVEGRRPDITIIDDRTRLDENLGDVPDVIDHYLGRRPVYIIRLANETSVLAETYELAPLSDAMGSGLARVLRRRPDAP